MVPQEDLRITKTRKALTEALLVLLSKKNFQKITVNDICQEALVSRSTFYLHFEDKYQLLLFCLKREQEYLREKAESTDIREFLHKHLAAIKEHAYIYRNLISANDNRELTHMFQNHFHETFTSLLTGIQKQGTELAGPIPLLAAYYSNGLTGMVIWWIENKYLYSIEEMTLCQYNLLADLLPE